MMAAPAVMMMVVAHPAIIAILPHSIMMLAVASVHSIHVSTVHLSLIGPVLIHGPLVHLPLGHLSLIHGPRILPILSQGGRARYA